VPDVAADRVMRDYLDDLGVARLPVATKWDRLSARERVSARRRLEALSPLAVLGRGYAIVEGPDGRIRTEVAALRAGEQGTLRMRDGRAGVRIESVEVTDGRA